MMSKKGMLALRAGVRGKLGKHLALCVLRPHHAARDQSQHPDMNRVRGYCGRNGLVGLRNDDGGASKLALR